MQWELNRNRLRGRGETLGSHLDVPLYFKPAQCSEHPWMLQPGIALHCCHKAVWKLHTRTLDGGHVGAKESFREAQKVTWVSCRTIAVTSIKAVHYLLCSVTMALLASPSLFKNK